MTVQQFNLSITEGIVKVSNIQSECVKEITLNPWDDNIEITFQSTPHKTYIYGYCVNFQRGLISRLGTEKSIGSFVSLSLKTLVRK